jgi:hypothetical protein
MNAMKTMTKNEGPALCEVKSSELQAITGGDFGGLGGGGLGSLPPPPANLLVDVLYKPWLVLQLPEPPRHAPPPKG